MDFDMVFKAGIEFCQSCQSNVDYSAMISAEDDKGRVKNGIIWFSCGHVKIIKNHLLIDTVDYSVEV